MEILSPVWPSSVPLRARRTARPTHLEGTSVALVDDRLDEAFTLYLEELLAKRFGAKVLRFPKPFGTAPSPPELIDDAASHGQAAIVGIGL
jgi:hypothetical protein